MKTIQWKQEKNISTQEIKMNKLVKRKRKRLHVQANTNEWINNK